MLTPEERALLTEVSDRLIDLFVQRDEACKDEDWGRADALQDAIDQVREERRRVMEDAE